MSVEQAFAYALNDLDQVVGRSWMPTGPSHSFLYDHGQMTDLNPLNSGNMTSFLSRRRTSRHALAAVQPVDRRSKNENMRASPEG